MCEKVPKDVTHSLGVLACALEGNVSSVTFQRETLSLLIPCCPSSDITAVYCGAGSVLQTTLLKLSTFPSGS